jgi:hypothetical protein
MQEYKEFRPTSFDPKGLALEDQQNWLVLPCSQNRDSDVLAKSNFEVALLELGGEGEHVEVHRFGHWGPGWFEIIIVDPASEKHVKIAEEIENSLADYPVLDESHFSESEWEAKIAWWENMSHSERLYYCRKAGVDGRKARSKSIPEDVDQYLEV